VKNKLIALALIVAAAAAWPAAQTFILHGSIVEKLYIPAAACQNATAVSEWSTPVSNPAVFACVTGSNTQRGVADFADGANSLSMQYKIQLPSDWTTATGGIDVNLYWHTTAIAGNVVFQTQTICVADAETADPAFNTADAFAADTAKGTTLQLNTASDTSITVTGCAAGEMLYLKVFRDPAHASDTLAATARLEGVELTYRRAL
jgi:hypothetical protein